jgi:3-methyladenine DNA glycosylase AlkD
MTADQILKEIKPLGSESYCRIPRNHGVVDPMYGVKISDLKKIQKRVKMDYQLAKDLFDTGIYDARYLGGLIADDANMTKADLEGWLKKSNCSAVRCFTIAWVAAGSPHGYDLALKWIDSKDPNAQEAGWATLCGIVAMTEDAKLDIVKLKQLLQRVEKTIQNAQNDVRYAMNNFVIAVGSYVLPLTEPAIQTGKKIGEVKVDMGNTSCEVPFGPDYIEKVRKRGSLGKKRMTMKC